MLSFFLLFLYFFIIKTWVDYQKHSLAIYHSMNPIKIILTPSHKNGQMTKDTDGYLVTKILLILTHKDGRMIKDTNGCLVT